MICGSSSAIILGHKNLKNPEDQLHWLNHIDHFLHFKKSMAKSFLWPYFAVGSPMWDAYPHSALNRSTRHGGPWRLHDALFGQGHLALAPDAAGDPGGAGPMDSWKECTRPGYDWQFAMVKPWSIDLVRGFTYGKWWVIFHSYVKLPEGRIMCPHWCFNIAMVKPWPIEIDVFPSVCETSIYFGDFPWLC
jgi:hypothetical protein